MRYRGKDGNERPWEPPRAVQSDGFVRVLDGDTDDKSDDTRNRPGTGWLRISDDSVRECGIESVLAEGSGAFMLYYERGGQQPALPVRHTAAVGAGATYVYPLDGSRSSEETLKPVASMNENTYTNGPAETTLMHPKPTVSNGVAGWGRSSEHDLKSSHSTHLPNGIGH